MNRLFTVQAYSLVMFFSTALVLIIGFLLWLQYDGSVQNDFGLRQSVAELLTASMLPVILINLIGFRESAFTTIVNIGQENEPKEFIPISSGGTFLYVIGLMGVFSALTCIFVVSGPIESQKAKIVITLTAAVWGGTTGVVFNKYFKQYT